MKHTEKHYWVPHFLAVMLLFPLLATAENGGIDNAELTERVLWKNTPIAVNLNVDKERLVRFPSSVSVGVPPGLASLLRSQSINGTLYLTAHEPFEATRVLVRAEGDGPVYVLDVSATDADPESPSLPMVQILDAKPAPVGLVSDTTETTVPQWGYVALTRYAAQQLYAPARLLPSMPGIVRMPVPLVSFELVMGGQVEAIPVAAWRAGLHTVTAVELRNKSSHPVVLDPRQLRGSWLTATFQHNRLLPSGDEADSTAVYLVSDRPFEVSF
ncbi:MAG: TIGR03749 family integrating conjugative element protein [Cellvibrionales bacterium]|nr:MAG: TIGR03749 family integrating conjugative element protein [Cellvibrionales bacterium]